MWEDIKDALETSVIFLAICAPVVVVFGTVVWLASKGIGGKPEWETYTEACQNIGGKAVHNGKHWECIK